jgi:hypothetical protein
MMFQMMGAFAEFERFKAGLSRARSHGKWLGRRRVKLSSVSASMPTDCLLPETT